MSAQIIKFPAVKLIPFFVVCLIAGQVETIKVYAPSADACKKIVAETGIFISLRMTLC